MIVLPAISRDAGGDHVIEGEADGLAGGNGEAAAGVARVTFRPADLFVVVGEFGPELPVREDFPRQSRRSG